MLFFWRHRRADMKAAQALYDKAVAQARHPSFYISYGVADTVDGRFDMICLHAFMVMERLSSEGKPGQAINQALFDVMFNNMDLVLREMGVGDLGIPKHIKRMMKAFHGRAAVYRKAVREDDSAALLEALQRNVFRKQDHVSPAVLRMMAAYVTASLDILRQTALQDLQAGNLKFAAPDNDKPESHKPDDHKEDHKNDTDTRAGMVA